jgi:hypothetical protein
MMDETAYGDREIADLLPWYETGRLSSQERQRVAAAIEGNPALERELGLVREEMVATIAANDAQGRPSRRAAEQFMAKLEASPRGRVRVRFVAFVADWLAMLRPQTLAWGAMAALAVLIAQAGFISHLALDGRSASVYQTASVSDEVSAGRPVLLVAFAPSASAAAIQSLLEANALSIVAGPAAGYYSVRVDGADDAKVGVLITRLTARKDIVQSVMRQSPPD